MINVTVSYTVKKDFVETNKQNISTFLNDFKNLDQNRFSYRILLKDDGITFVHISKYSDEEIQTELLNTASFLEFQKQRDESGLNGSHKVEILEFIGESGSF